MLSSQQAPSHAMGHNFLNHAVSAREGCKPSVSLEMSEPLVRMDTVAITFSVVLCLTHGPPRRGMSSGPKHRHTREST